MSSKTKKKNLQKSYRKWNKIENIKVYPTYYVELNLTDTEQSLAICIYEIALYVSDIIYVFKNHDNEKYIFIQKVNQPYQL